MSRCVQRSLGAVVLALLIGLITTTGFVKQASAATPSGAPSISATPGTPQTGGAAKPGATVNVTGTGFGTGETITLSLNGASLTPTPSPLSSANDGSFSATFVVPSLAVRAYPLVAQGQSGDSASLIFWLQAASENVYAPKTGQDSYHITDSNTREPQMNYLRITNTEDANLVNPKVLPDSLPGQDPFLDTSSPTAIVQGILAHPEATTDAQKAFVLWQWVTNNSYHYYDAENPDPKVNLDTTAILNNYGYTRCWNHARLLADLFQAAGYQTRTWNLSLHAVPEVYYAGAWHEYDPDQRKVYVDATGNVLGVQDLISNPHPLFLNTSHNGNVRYYSNFRYTAPYTANLYATSGDNQSLSNGAPNPHSLGITLRKNETLMEYWSNIGKYHDNYLHSAAPPVYSNGDIVYTPDLSQASYQSGVLNQTNVSQDGSQPNLHAQTVGTTPSSVVYQVKSPYTLVGSLLNAQTYLGDPSKDSLSIFFSLDGNTWGSPVYTQSKTGYDNPSMNLSKYLNDGTLAEQYSYYVKFQWTANVSPTGAGLVNFSLDSQFEQAWEAIPPLHSGTTTITYRDQSGSGGTHTGVQIAYGWTPQSAMDFGKSSLKPDSTSIPANGTSFANVVLTLKTAAGTPVPNMAVQLSSSGVTTQVARMYQYQGLRSQTDSNGQAVFEVRSQQTGTATLTATDTNGTSLGLSPVTLTFTSPPPVTLTRPSIT